MTITIGWWATPAIFTVVSLVWAFLPSREQGYGADVVGIVQFLASIIVSLVAWLVWALFA